MIYARGASQAVVSFTCIRAPRVGDVSAPWRLWRVRVREGRKEREKEERRWAGVEVVRNVHFWWSD